MGGCNSKTDTKAMGGCNSKTDTDVILEAIAEVGKKVDVVNDTLNDYISGKYISKAAKAAMRYTAIAVVGKKERKVVAPGLLVKIEEKVYFLTAAHAALFLCEKDASVIWQGYPEYPEDKTKKVTFCDFSGLFLDPRYVKDGDRDIAFLEVDEIFDVPDAEPSPLHTEHVSLSSRMELRGQRIEAHGGSVLKGYVRSIPSPLEDSFRMRLHSFNGPGNNGAPCFTDMGKLAAIVHGRSKDRICIQSRGELPGSYVYAEHANVQALEAFPVKSQAVLDALNDLVRYSGFKRINAMAPGQDKDGVMQSDADLIRKFAKEFGHSLSDSDNKILEKGDTENTQNRLKERDELWGRVLATFTDQALAIGRDSLHSLRSADSLQCFTPFAEHAMALGANEGS